MEWNHIFCCCKSGTFMRYFIKTCWFFLLLFYNWSGSWGFWIASPNVVCLLLSFYAHYMMKYEICFFLFEKCRLPFDWKNPIGYLIAVTLQYIIAIYAAIFMSCIVTLGFGAFLFAVAVNKISKQSLYTICKKAKHKTSQTHLLKRLHEFIHFYSSVKQLSVLKSNLWMCWELKLKLKLKF